MHLAGISDPLFTLRLRTQIEEMERTHAIALAAKDNELSKANDEVASAVATATSVKTSTSDLKAENVRLKSGIQSYENKVRQTLALSNLLPRLTFSG